MPDMGVATGNWGCGAFMGYKPLKALIQILAASEANRPNVLYSPFGDAALVKCLDDMLKFAHKKSLTVGDFYRYLLEFLKENEDILAYYERDYRFMYDLINSISEKLLLKTNGDGDDIEEEDKEPGNNEANVEGNALDKEANVGDNVSGNEVSNVKKDDNEANVEGNEPNNEVNIEKKDGNEANVGSKEPDNEANVGSNVPDNEVSIEKKDDNKINVGDNEDNEKES